MTDLNDFTDDAPGADDDASGVAVSMELARVMATHESAATLIFAAVAGEEQDLFGSAFMAAQLKKDGVDVQGMLDNDIVGSSTADDGTTDRFDLRMFVQGIPTIETPSEISELTSIGAESTSVGPLCIRGFSKCFNPDERYVNLTTTSSWFYIHESLEAH